MIWWKREFHYWTVECIRSSSLVHKMKAYSMLSFTTITVSYIGHKFSLSRSLTAYYIRNRIYDTETLIPRSHAMHFNTRTEYLQDFFHFFTKKTIKNILESLSEKKNRCKKDLKSRIYSDFCHKPYLLLSYSLFPTVTLLSIRDIFVMLKPITLMFAPELKHFQLLTICILSLVFFSFILFVNER